MKIRTRKRLACLMVDAFLFILACGIAGAEGEAGAPRLSEACASNKACYITEDGAAPDWIELYNPSAQALSLDGWYLSKDEEDLTAFSLQGLTMEPQGYLVLRADKKQLPFKLSASGDTLLLSDGARILEKITLPPLEKDETYARQASGEWHITSQATPAAPNAAGQVYQKKVFVAAPELSQPAGFYSDPMTLTLSAASGTTIYYTTDGSMPTTASSVYTEPLELHDATINDNRFCMISAVSIRDYHRPWEQVVKCNVIRAVAIDADGNASKVVTASYFVGLDRHPAYQGMPVLSLVTDPDGLFNEHTGIYMLGDVYQNWLTSDKYDPNANVSFIPSNFTQRGRDYEIAADVAYFEADHTLGFEQSLGLRIQGNASRTLTQKSLQLLARSEYEFGKSQIDYRFWSDRARASKINLKGPEIAVDATVHSLLSDSGQMWNHCQPVLLFLNGEFWGLYEIREKGNAEQIAKYYDLKEEDVVVLKNIAASNGEAENGDEEDIKRYRSEHTYFAELDMTLEGNYLACQERFDLDSFITAMAVYVYTENIDSGINNLNESIWFTKTVSDRPYADGKYRWILQDLDETCSLGWGQKDTVKAVKDEKLFTALMANADFRSRFLTRLCDMGNLYFTPERVEKAVSASFDYYRPYYAETRARYGNARSDENMVNNGAKFKAFFLTRQAAVIAGLREHWGIENATHTVKVSAPRAFTALGGSLSVNGHAVESADWTGLYYDVSRVTLSAAGIADELFLGWYTAEGERLSGDKEFVLDVTRDHEIYPRVKLPSEMEAPRVSAAWPMSAAEEGMTIAVSGPWTPENGITVEMDTAYASVLELEMHWQAPEEATRWQAQYSLDGESWTDIGAPLTLRGETTWWLEMPEETLDAGKVEVRFLGAEEIGEKTLVLLSARGMAVREEITLSALKTAERLLGAEGPDEEGLKSLPQEEIDARVAAWRRETIRARAADDTEIAAEQADPELARYGSAPLLTVDAALVRLNEEIEWAIPADYAEVWLYAEEDGEWTLKEQFAREDRAFVILPPQDASWLLLPREIGTYPPILAVSAEWRSEETVKTVFHGAKPAVSLWMQVSQAIPAEREMTLTLPAAWNQASVTIYRCEGSRLTAVGSGQRVRDGILRVSDLSEGDYLLLNKPVEYYEDLYQEKLRREKMLYMAIGAAGLIVVALIVLIIVRAKRSRRRPQAAPAPVVRRRKG